MCKSRKRNPAHKHTHILIKRQRSFLIHSVNQQWIGHTYKYTERETTLTIHTLLNLSEDVHVCMLAGSTFVISVASCSAVVDNGRLLHRRRPLITMLASRETRCNVIPIDSYISGICSEEGAPSYTPTRSPVHPLRRLFRCLLNSFKYWDYNV